VRGKQYRWVEALKRAPMRPSTRAIGIELAWRLGPDLDSDAWPVNLRALADTGDGWSYRTVQRAFRELRQTGFLTYQLRRYRATDSTTRTKIVNVQCWVPAQHAGPADAPVRQRSLKSDRGADSSRPPGRVPDDQKPESSSAGDYPPAQTPTQPTPVTQAPSWADREVDIGRVDPTTIRQFADQLRRKQGEPRNPGR
jgi:hypothetical protein